VNRRRDAALAQIAAGRPRAAVWHFGRILEVHRWNHLQATLPVGVGECFERIGDVLESVDQPIAAAAARALARRGGQSFYRPAESCQIPILGGLYEHVFGERRDGTFVEVGAYDGHTFSNTSCLADLGWGGLYIEPIPWAFEQCRQRHRSNPRVTALNCAIGAHDGTVELWVAGQFSTASTAVLEHDIARGWLAPGAAERHEVPQLRLDTALRQTAIQPGFDLLVVDVEGMEESVFDGFDVDYWRPGCMIVELIEDDDDDSRSQMARRLRKRIESHGYAEVYGDGGNAMFRRSPP